MDDDATIDGYTTKVIFLSSLFLQCREIENFMMPFNISLAGFNFISICSSVGAFVHLLCRGYFFRLFQLATD